MSSNIVIDVKNIFKTYRIFRNPIDRIKQLIYKNKKYYHEVTALKNITFQVVKGDCLGIIGLNGSGKSTLLQIISQISCPTKGKVIIHGRMASILELGSGFNPQFTGRENIYINASLHGLSKLQIDSRIDKIIAFADIGNFIDEPVKTYSSGMHVRLAFSIITNVDADILIIDEALAVGDINFTYKCMGFLDEFKAHGTILFVTHDLNSTLNLCNKLLLLEKGKITSHGDTRDVLDFYTQSHYKNIHPENSKIRDISKKSTAHYNHKTDKSINFEAFFGLNSSTGFTSGNAKITDVKLFNAKGIEQIFFNGGDYINLQIHAHVSKNISSPLIGWALKDSYGFTVSSDNTFNCNVFLETKKVRSNIQANFEFQLPLLRNGKYFLSVAISEGTNVNPHYHHWLNQAVVFDVNTTNHIYGLLKIQFKNVSLKKSSKRI